MRMDACEPCDEDGCLLYVDYECALHQNMEVHLRLHFHEGLLDGVPSPECPFDATHRMSLVGSYAHQGER